MSRIRTTVALVALALLASLLQAESVSMGTTANGSLQGGVSLPADGPGFVTYSRVGNLLGRQYVNSRVRDTLLACFGALHAARAERTFVVGETGWKAGGRFRPHKTHQNGLSVDIFVPVRDAKARWVLMPTAPWNKFGYSLDFDAAGKRGNLSIDFEAVAQVLVGLAHQAPQYGLALERIIVAPEYVSKIVGVAGVAGIEPLSGLFMKGPAWVRHDEHFPVDFRVVAQRPKG